MLRTAAPRLSGWRLSEPGDVMLRRAYHEAMKGLGTVAVAALAAWAFFSPPPGSWAFAVAELVFLAWLAREVRKADAASLAAAASEPLEPDETEIVQRFAFYFTRPPLARECASILAALGLASLVLVPWLTYKLQWAQAILIGFLLFAVARLTKLLGPLFALRVAANTGDRDALRLLAAHDAALRKVRNRAAISRSSAS